MFGVQQTWPGQFGDGANLRQLLQIQDPGHAARQVLERVNRLQPSDHDLHELCETLPDLLTKLFGSGMRHPGQTRLADDTWTGIGWADYGFQTSADSDVVRQLLSSKSQPDPKMGLLARCLDIVKKSPPPCLFKYRYDKLPQLTREALSSHRIGGVRRESLGLLLQRGTPEFPIQTFNPIEYLLLCLCRFLIPEVSCPFASGSYRS